MDVQWALSRTYSLFTHTIRCALRRRLRNYISREDNFFFALCNVASRRWWCQMKFIDEFAYALGVAWNNSIAGQVRWPVMSSSSNRFNCKDSRISVQADFPFLPSITRYVTQLIISISDLNGKWNKQTEHTENKTNQNKTKRNKKRNQLNKMHSALCIHNCVMSKMMIMYEYGGGGGGIYTDKSSTVEHFDVLRLPDQFLF